MLQEEPAWPNHCDKLSYGEEGLAMQGQRSPMSSRGRMAALVEELAKDSRSFRDLTPEERRERLGRLRGIGRGLTSGSEEFARRKIEEIEIEDRKLGR